MVKGVGGIQPPNNGHKSKKANEPELEPSLEYLPKTPGKTKGNIQKLYHKMALKLEEFTAILLTITRR